MLRSKSPQADKNGELSFIVSAISQVPRGWHSGSNSQLSPTGQIHSSKPVFVSVSDWQLEIESVCSPLGRKVADAFLCMPLDMRSSHKGGTAVKQTRRVSALS
jgi:hypothetical protein